jgi:hypothetical protein
MSRKIRSGITRHKTASKSGRDDQAKNDAIFILKGIAAALAILKGIKDLWWK